MTTSHLSQVEPSPETSCIVNVPVTMDSVQHNSSAVGSEMSLGSRFCRFA